MQDFLINRPYLFLPAHVIIDVDLLTHAFSVILLAQHLDVFLIGFGVTGTILPDADILLQRFSDTDPHLYIFSHGGITHSIAGSLLLAIVGFFAICLLQLAGIISLPGDRVFWMLGLGMIMGGALVHITLDYLAYPGMPLFYPFSDRKYTLGIFPGPSLFLMLASVLFLIALITGISGMDDLFLYGIVFFSFIAFSLAKKTIIARRFRKKQTIPTFHPLHWIIVSDDEEKYTVSHCSLFGTVNKVVVYQKRDGVEEEEIEALADNPMMKRLRYFSYFFVSERKSGYIRIYDPLRISGLIFYPASHREFIVKPPPLST